jgi:hypothetical protein
MKKFFSTGSFRLTAFVGALLILGGIASAQGKAEIKDKTKDRSGNFCSSENWSSDNKESYRELREMTVAPGGPLSVDAGRNGGISVKGEDRADILVRACVQAWGDTLDTAKALVAGVKVTTTNGVHADGGGEENYSVSYQILVPRFTDLDLKAHNGGISISSVKGRVEFRTTNGGVDLTDLSGDVSGQTSNGGVNVQLAGRGWDGAGLNVQTTNGGVRVAVPQGYAANFEAGTVNGGFSSDVPALNVSTEDTKGGWNNRSRQVNTAINGGGAPIRVSTVNGGVKINSTTGEKN